MRSTAAASGCFEVELIRLATLATVHDFVSLQCEPTIRHKNVVDQLLHDHLVY